MQTGTEVWEEVASSWEQDRGATAVRAYSDAVNRALLERWLPERMGTVLKTDLFDEATADGLVGLLLERADRAIGIDVAPSIVDAAAGIGEESRRVPVREVFFARLAVAPDRGKRAPNRDPQSRGAALRGGIAGRRRRSGWSFVPGSRRWSTPRSATSARSR